jgi:cysteine desulfurase/selenocysteine lyase
VCGGIAFGAALDYMNAIGLDAIAAYEQELLDYTTEALKKIDGVIIYGPKTNKTSVISFNVEGIHPYDIGTLLDKMGVAVRTGHHCAQPVMGFFIISPVPCGPPLCFTIPSKRWTHLYHT